MQYEDIGSLKELNAVLESFRQHYNAQRPHQAPGFPGFNVAVGKPPSLPPFPEYGPLVGFAVAIYTPIFCNPETIELIRVPGLTPFLAS
ncbi:MAG: transposase [Thermaceae bacterium]|nr:transposase [Thermaceae bacterium]